MSVCKESWYEKDDSLAPLPGNKNSQVYDVYRAVYEVSDDHRGNAQEIAIMIDANPKCSSWQRNPLVPNRKGTYDERIVRKKVRHAVYQGFVKEIKPDNIFDCIEYQIADVDHYLRTNAEYCRKYEERREKEKPVNQLLKNLKRGILEDADREALRKLASVKRYKEKSLSKNIDWKTVTASMFGSSAVMAIILTINHALN